jgi:uncharacterized membrane protein YvlD (DUF360 family)
VPNHAGLLLTVTTVALCALVVWVPGGLIAAATGLRNWSLLAVAPLLTYFVAGVAGPWLWKIGIPFTPITFGVYALALAAVFLWLRRFSRGADPRPEWTPRAHLAAWSRAKSSVWRNRNTRPPACLPMAAACSGVAALAMRIPHSPVGGATTTQRLSADTAASSRFSKPSTST